MHHRQQGRLPLQRLLVAGTGLRTPRDGERGYTLVELLVVILVIGILAGIALPAFLSQREKAQDTEAKTNVRTAQTAMETYAAGDQGYTTDEAELEAIEPAVKQFSSRMTLSSGTGSGGYKIEIVSQGRNTNRFSFDLNAATRRTCSTSGKGGCPAGGSW